MFIVDCIFLIRQDLNIQSFWSSERNKTSSKYGQALNYLNILTESGAVFKVAQNPFNKMWHRLPVALGVKLLEDKLAWPYIDLPVNQN